MLLREFWDPSVLPTFYDNAVAISAGDILSVNYLFGTVTFTGSKTGPITMDGSYYPFYQIADAYEWNLSLTSNPADISAFEDTARNRLPLLFDGSGSFEINDTVQTDYINGAGVKKIETIYLQQTDVVLFFRTASTQSQAFRMWAHLTDFETSAGVEDLINSSVNFEMSAKSDSAGRAASFSFSDS